MCDKDRDCRKCTEFKRRQGLEPDCSKCNRPELLPENNIIDYLIGNYGRMLTTGDGGISADAIRLVLEIEEIENKTLITQKIIVYLRTVLEIQFKEISDGGKNNTTKS